MWLKKYTIFALSIIAFFPSVGFASSGTVYFGCADFNTITGGAACDGSNVVFSGANQSVSDETPTDYFLDPGTTYYLSMKWNGTSRGTVNSWGLYDNGGTGEWIDEPFLADGSTDYLFITSNGGPGVHFEGIIYDICITTTPGDCVFSPPSPESPTTGGMSLFSSTTADGTESQMQTFLQNTLVSLSLLTILAISIPLVFFIIHEIKAFFKRRRRRT